MFKANNSRVFESSWAQAQELLQRRKFYVFARVIPIAVLAVAIAWPDLGCGGSSPGALAATQPAPPEVVVAKPIQHDIDLRMGFLGQFQAANTIELRAQVGGTLTGVYFRDGDIVHKGDLLFTIDRVPYDIKLAEARAQLKSASARSALANRQLTRANTLQRGDAGSVDNVDQRLAERNAADGNIEAAQAQIRDAQFDLDHCEITAPMTGRIGTHLISVGNLVAGSRTASSPTTLLTTLVSLDPIWVTFDMSEADYDTYQRSQSHGQANRRLVGIQLNGEHTYSRIGVLDFIDNAIDRSSGVIHARVTVANPSFDLTPGSFARLRLEVGEPLPALLVPDASVLPDQSHHTVMTVNNDGVVVAKLVGVGELRGTLRIIRSGLAADDRVIIDGLVYAAPGQKVKTIDGVIPSAALAQD